MADFSAQLAKIAAIKESNPNNIAVAQFDEAYFNSLASDQDKTDFLQCMASGIENADSGMGCYAVRPDDYSKFEPYFIKCLEAYHKVDLSGGKVHVNNWDLSGCEGLPEGGVLDLANLGLPALSVRARVGRNFNKFPLPGAMTKQDRIDMEKLMGKAFEVLIADPEFGGKYNSITPGHPNFIDEAAYNQLVKEHIMFKDMSVDPYLMSAGIAQHWPHGRGCYHSADKTFVVWVGEEDHLRIVSMNPKTTVLNSVFDRLNKVVTIIEGLAKEEGGFAKHEKFGVVTSCPTNIGTGMRASVLIKIPNLTAGGSDAKAKQICKPLHLSVRGMGGEHTAIGADGTCDISPSGRFCISEAEILCALYKGVSLLKVEEDKAKIPASLAKIAAIKKSNPSNIAVAQFDEAYFNSLASDQDKIDFLQCMASGIENADSGMGCYAVRPDDYTKFEPYFIKCLEAYHKVDLSGGKVHVNNWDLSGCEGLPEGGVLDLANLGLSAL
jgi:creatine kinase